MAATSEKGTSGKTEATPDAGASSFIRDLVRADLASNKHGGRVVTRFPPEPNGYLHIGHVKSICLNFGLALEFQGACHLRVGDPHPPRQESADPLSRDREKPQLLGSLAVSWKRVVALNPVASAPG